MASISFDDFFYKPIDDLQIIDLQLFIYLFLPQLIFFLIGKVNINKKFKHSKYYILAFFIFTHILSSIIFINSLLFYNIPAVYLNNIILSVSKYLFLMVFIHFLFIEASSFIYLKTNTKTKKFIVISIFILSCINTIFICLKVLQIEKITLLKYIDYFYTFTYSFFLITYTLIFTIFIFLFFKYIGEFKIYFKKYVLNIIFLILLSIFILINMFIEQNSSFNFLLNLFILIFEFIYIIIYIIFWYINKKKRYIS